MENVGKREEDYFSRRSRNPLFTYTSLVLVVIIISTIIITIVGLNPLFIFPVIGMILLTTVFNRIFPDAEKNRAKQRRTKHLLETQDSGDFYLGKKFDQLVRNSKKGLNDCPSCFTRNQLEDEFCQNCGTRIKKIEIP